MFKINRYFIIGFLAIGTIFLTSCAEKNVNSSNVNAQSSQTLSQKENEIKNKISEIDKSAKEGKYHYAVTMLDLLKTDYDFSQYKDLKQKIDNKRDDYQFKEYSSISLDSLRNKDYYNALCNLRDLVKNYNQKKELKEVCIQMLSEIEKNINTSKTFNEDISQMLLYITIVYPENKASIKQLYDLNKTYTNEKIDGFEEAFRLIENSLTPKTIDQKREPAIGMSKADVEYSTWGKPKKVNETITANNKHEQWVYQGDKYIYFENGIVTAIQK